MRKVWTRFRWLSHKWVEEEMRRKADQAAAWQRPRSPELEAAVARAGSRVGAAREAGPPAGASRAGGLALRLQLLPDLLLPSRRPRCLLQPSGSPQAPRGSPAHQPTSAACPSAQEDDALETLMQWLHSRMGQRSTPIPPPSPPQPPRPPPLYRQKEHQELPGLREAAQIAEWEAEEAGQEGEERPTVTMVEVGR